MRLTQTWLGKFAQPLSIALCALLLAVPVATAQFKMGVSDEANASAKVPQPESLSGDWWAYFNGKDVDITARVDTAIKELLARKDQIAEVDGLYELERIEQGLGAWQKLRQRKFSPANPVEPARDQYTFEEALAIDRLLREERIRFRADSAELSAKQRTVSALEKRYNSAFAVYLTKQPLERLKIGLGLYADRVALGIERERVRLLRDSATQSEQRVETLTSLSNLSFDRITDESQSVESLQGEISAAQRALLEAERATRNVETQSLEINDGTDLGQAKDRSVRQLVILKSVIEAQADLRLMSLKAKYDYATLVASPKDSDLRAQIKENAQLRGLRMERIAAKKDIWVRASESNLIVSAVDATGLGGELVRVRNERADDARQTLLRMQMMNEAYGDLAFIRQLIAREVGLSQGTLRKAWTLTSDNVSRIYARFSDFGEYSLFTIGGTPITSFGIMRVLLIMLFAVWASRLLRHALQRFGASRASMSQSALYSLGRLAHYVIMIVALIVGLSSVGLDFSNLALIAGALSVGVGFGLQSIVSNFVSGLILLFERSLNVGDYVELDSGITGVVKEISVRSTLINTNDNIDILVPNSEFINGRLINWTLRDASRRLHIKFGVAYGTDKEIVKKAALEAAAEVPDTYTSEGRDPQVWFVNFGDSSLDFELVVWVTQASVRSPGAINARYLWAMDDALRRHSIEVPFPQRDLHIRSGLNKPASQDKTSEQL